MLAPVLIAAPATAPVSLEEAKAWCRVDTSDEDGLIAALVEAATAHLDGWSGILGRALVTQSWRQDFASFGDRLHLPLAPAQSIASVQYYDETGTARTLAAESYVLLTDARGPYVALAPGTSSLSYSWPSTQARADAVGVTFVAGYGAAADVPWAIKNALLELAAHWFENREAVNVGNIVTELPLGVRASIAPFRRVGF